MSSVQGLGFTYHCVFPFSPRLSIFLLSMQNRIAFRIGPRVQEPVPKPCSSPMPETSGTQFTCFTVRKSTVNAAKVIAVFLESHSHPNSPADCCFRTVFYWILILIKTGVQSAETLLEVSTSRPHRAYVHPSPCQMNENEKKAFIHFLQSKKLAEFNISARGNCFFEAIVAYDFVQKMIKENTCPVIYGKVYPKIVKDGGTLRLSAVEHLCAQGETEKDSVEWKGFVDAIISRDSQEPSAPIYTDFKDYCEYYLVPLPFHPMRSVDIYKPQIHKCQQMVIMQMKTC